MDGEGQQFSAQGNEHTIVAQGLVTEGLDQRGADAAGVTGLRDEVLEADNEFVSLGRPSDESGAERPDPDAWARDRRFKGQRNTTSVFGFPLRPKR